MVFRRIGLHGYMNKTLNKWIESEQPIHFHLKMSCLRKHDPTMEMCYITTNDEFFIDMDDEQMAVLPWFGFSSNLSQGRRQIDPKIYITGIGVKKGYKTSLEMRRTGRFSVRNRMFCTVFSPNWNRLTVFQFFTSC